MSTNQKITWSDIQQRRLKELGVGTGEDEACFQSGEERDRAFQALEKKIVKSQRFQLEQMRKVFRKPLLCRFQEQLVECLTTNGFVQVTTPTIMSRQHLAKMTIDEKHPLYSQVFWIDKNRCLRPMLAPHLYYILKDLLRIWEKPVRLFEVGSCFRKESQGTQHAEEFTMLNLVEMGLAETGRQQRLKYLAELVMKSVGIDSYRLRVEESSVYGETIDIEAGPGNIEVGSAAIGPHFLDHAWRITEPWVGIGFGLERLIMVKENSPNLAAVSRSLSYLDGIRLSI